jgi:hypothetical protein
LGPTQNEIKFATFDPPDRVYLKILLGEVSYLVTDVSRQPVRPIFNIQGVQDPVVSLGSLQFHRPKAKCNTKILPIISGENPAEKKSPEEQISALFDLFLLSTSWKEQGNKQNVEYLADVRLRL